MISNPGAYKIPAEEYHSDPVVNPSLSRGVIMDILFRSPLHAWANHPRLNPACKPTNDHKFDIGQAAHSLFLEGIDKAEIIEADNWMKKESKERRDQAWQDGKIPLLTKEYDRVSEMVCAANKALGASELSGLFDGGDAELTYVWKDGPSWCRVRLDKITKDREIVLDYKTTGTSANPEDFIRLILSKGYDVQEVFYRRGVKAVEGIDPKFILMVQENEPPYPCSFIGLSPEFHAMAEQKVIRGIDLWGNCMASGEWPGYPPRICWIDPPAWALNWEMRATFLGSSMEEI